MEFVRAQQFPGTFQFHSGEFDPLFQGGLRFQDLNAWFDSPRRGFSSGISSHWPLVCQAQLESRWDTAASISREFCANGLYYLVKRTEFLVTNPSTLETRHR